MRIQTFIISLQFTLNIFLLIAIMFLLDNINDNIIKLQNENSCVTEINHYNENYNDFVVMEKDLKEWKGLLK